MTTAQTYGGLTGIHSEPLSVTDHDQAHCRISGSGKVPDQEPFEIGGVPAYFVKSPGATPVEFIELPNGVHSTYETRRDAPFLMRPAK